MLHAASPFPLLASGQHYVQSRCFPHLPSQPSQDYELLEDNTGIRRQRPRQQHRRIKKARDAGAAAAADSQDAARALQEELFGLEDEQAGLEDDEDEAAPGRAATAAPRQGGDARGGARDEGLDGGEDQVGAAALAACSCWLWLGTGHACGAEHALAQRVCPLAQPLSLYPHHTTPIPPSV